MVDHDHRCFSLSARRFIARHVLCATGYASALRAEGLQVGLAHVCLLHSQQVREPRANARRLIDSVADLMISLANLIHQPPRVSVRLSRLKSSRSRRPAGSVRCDNRYQSPGTRVLTHAARRFIARHVLCATGYASALLAEGLHVGLAHVCLLHSQQVRELRANAFIESRAVGHRGVR